ncbi:MAG: nucleoside triphosphate pyrophosphohydrolase, partial [Lysobacterales bacterium]
MTINDDKPRIDDLLAIMARLRDRERGCPWDLEQSFETIAPYTIEEAYEVADAIDRRDYAHLRDELGDLLLQVVFHARMAEEAGHFAFGDVVASICDKMVRRHPHVFADAQIAASATAQLANWEDLKAAERATRDAADASALAGIARGVPEWQRALKLQQRAARVGFDWPDVTPVFDKLHEEIDEVRAEFANGGGS